MSISNYAKAAAAVGAIALLASCGSDGDSGSGGDGTKPDILRIALPAEPANLDPHITANFVISEMTRPILETLLTMDSKGEMQLMLAESYTPSPDGLSMEFKLREGVKFHDGSDLDSEDVVASMQRWIANSTPGGAFFGDSTWAAPDDLTVTVTFEEPSFQHEFQLMSHVNNAPVIMPSEVVEAAGEEALTEPIGTGPYKFVEWKSAQYVTLEKWDDYRARSEPADGMAGDRTGKIETLEFDFVSDPSTATNGVLSGEYDIVTETPFDALERLKASDEVVVEPYQPNTQHLVFNAESTDSPIAKEAIRKAIYQGINREDIMRTAVGTSGDYVIDNDIMASIQYGIWKSDVDSEIPPQDIEGAKAAIAAAGYDGEPLRLLATKDYVDTFNAAVVLNDQLKALGLNVEMETVDWASFSETFNSLEGWDLLVFPNSVQNDPTSVNGFRPGRPAFVEELQPLIDEFNASLTLDEARDKLDTLQQFRADHRWVVKLGETLSMYTAPTALQTPLPINDRTITYWAVEFD